MRARTMTISGLLVTALAFIAAAWTWAQLPPDAQIASHWNIHGQIDGHMAKTPGLFLLPGVLLVLTALFGAQLNLAPLRARLDEKGQTIIIVFAWWFALIALAAAEILIVGTALKAHGP